MTFRITGRSCNGVVVLPAGQPYEADLPCRLTTSRHPHNNYCIASQLIWLGLQLFTDPSVSPVSSSPDSAPTIRLALRLHRPCDALQDARPHTISVYGGECRGGGATGEHGQAEGSDQEDPRLVTKAGNYGTGRSECNKANIWKHITAPGHEYQ